MDEDQAREIKVGGDDEEVAPVVEGTLIREKWIEEAMESECACHLNDLLKDKNEEFVDKYKRTLFGHIYDQIGKDAKLARDLQGALMVKNRKFSPWQVAVLAILSLGIFYLIRPADDDAVLVLTKPGRVITLKMEREGLLTGNALTIILAFMKYLLIFVFALSVPSMIIWILISGQASSGRLARHFGEEYGISEIDRLQIDEETLQRIRKHYIIAAQVFVAFLVVFMIWLWSKCPSDYGNRFRESYTASSVSAGQFTVTGRKGWRKIIMRLYFGKYPTQEMLDMHGRMTGKQTAMVKSLPRSALAAEGGTGAGSKDATNLKRPSAGVVTAGLIILLSVVTMLDTALNWMGRAMAASEMYKVGKFCATTEKESLCTRKHCRSWANKEGHPASFCTTVEWHDKIHDKSQIATCASYGYAHPPCCGGCGIGEAMSFAKEGGWLAAFQEVLAVISDIGTLAFSIMAAASAVTMETSADHFDITINQVKWDESMDVTSNFDFTRPAAHDFFDMVFCKSREKDGSASRGNFVSILKHSMLGSHSFADESKDEEKPLAGNDQMVKAGVSNFELNTSATSWDEFFDEEGESLAKISWTENKVIVPVKCLGINQDPGDPRAERIVAAWTEKPRLMWTNMLTPMGAALLLMFILIVCPETISEDPITLPGFGTKAVGRVLSALVMGFLLIFLGGCYTYCDAYLNAVVHAVIVTDCRIFYIRHQAPCYCLCNCGMGLRVDCFRHDRNVNYGRVDSTPRSLMQRLTCSSIIPGTVTMQDKFGVLQMDRRFGNVFSVFNVVSQLAPQDAAGFLTKGVDNSDAAWNWDVTQSEAEAALDRVHIGDEPQHGVVHIKTQPEDVLTSGPGLYLITTGEDGSVTELEKPIFHWSVKKVGPMDSPLNTTSDVVVTTGRVFIWNRSSVKRFDCRTSLCWGSCWCGFLSALRSTDGMDNSISFFTLSSMLSFSTMTKVQPPVWTDPTHTPVKLPIVDSCCTFLTKFCTGNCGDISCEGSISDVGLCPLRTSPRIQLYMMWRLTTGPQQADLMASVCPYHHQDFEDVDLLKSLSCCEAGKSRTERETKHSRKIAQLRAIMGVAQDVADSAK